MTPNYFCGHDTPNYFFMPRTKPTSFPCNHCDEVFSTYSLCRNHFRYHCCKKLTIMENVLETLMLFKDVTPESLKGLLKGKDFTLAEFQKYCIQELQKEKNLVRYRQI